MRIIYYTIRGRLTVTVFSLAAAVVEVLALIVYLVAFITPWWGWLSINQNSGENTGLWRRCRDVANKPINCEDLVGNQSVPGLLVAAQCFAILGIITMVLNIATNLAYILIQRFNQDKRLVLAQTFIGVVCGASLLLTIAFWAAAYNRYIGNILDQQSNPDTIKRTFQSLNMVFNYSFGFSFYSCVGACVLTLISCVLLVSELRYNKFMIPA